VKEEKLRLEVVKMFELVMSVDGDDVLILMKEAVTLPFNPSIFQLPENTYSIFTLCVELQSLSKSSRSYSASIFCSFWT
jgi:hypothetical protein